MLAILTGLEIDSGKSGVKPDLSMYLRSGDVQRSRFLRYKYIAADPSLLYTFAVPGWKENLDAAVSAKVKAMAADYTHCLTRIRCSRQPYQNGKWITDIERILFARGQEDICDIDSLYAAFSALTYEEAENLYQALETEKWQFMIPEEREAFLQKYLHDFLWDVLYDVIAPHVRKQEVNRNA